MKTLSPLIVTLFFALSSSITWAQTPDKDDYISLFNGKNLAGWVNVNGKPETWQVRDGLLVCSGEPNGFIRNDKMYENYILEVEWRHATPGGNSGIFFMRTPLPDRVNPTLPLSKPSCSMAITEVCSASAEHHW